MLVYNLNVYERSTYQLCNRLLQHFRDYTLCLRFTTQTPYSIAYLGIQHGPRTPRRICRAHEQLW